MSQPNLEEFELSPKGGKLFNMPDNQKAKQRATPSKGQPSVDSVHDILVELGLEASVDGITKDMYLKAKSQLLAHALSLLPEKKIPHWRSKVGDEIEHTKALSFDEAIDLMEQSLREGYK